MFLLGGMTHTHTHTLPLTWEHEWTTDLYFLYLMGKEFVARFQLSFCFPAGVGADKALSVFGLFFFFLCWSRFSQEIRRSRNSLQISAQEITNSKHWRWIKGNLRVCDWLAGSDVLPVRPWMLSSLPVCFKEGLALIEMWKVNVYFKIIYWNKSGW